MDEAAPAMKRHKRLFWFGAALGAALLIPIWIYLNILQDDLASRPHQPDPARGWTVPYPGKGGSVYVTPREHATAVWLFRVDFALVLVVVFCGIMGSSGPLRRGRVKSD
jgi:hypothetical protein